jgi:hypothetical protein
VVIEEGRNERVGDRDCCAAVHDYTIALGASRLAVAGMRRTFQQAIAHAQKSRTGHAGSGGARCPRKRHAACNAGNAEAGNGAAELCFDSFVPRASTATGT